MALEKKIKKSNGIELNYHRIAMMIIEVNQRITIMLVSYLDDDGRGYEKKYEMGEIIGKPTFPYTETEYISLEYDETLNIESAYNWLKQQPRFDGALDV